MADDASNFEIVTPSAAAGAEIRVARANGGEKTADEENQAAILRATLLEIEHMDIPAESKQALRNSLISGGNIQAVISSAQSKAREADAEEDFDSSTDYARQEYLAAASEAEEAYCRNYNYSNEGRAYIRSTFASALENSPELQALKGKVDNLSPSERQEAEKELFNNAKQYEAMKDDPRYAPFKQDMDDAAKLGLINSEKGKQFLAMIEHGESPEKIRALKEEMTQHRVELAGQVIDSVHRGHTKEGTPAVGAEEMSIIEAKYSKPDGKLDHRRMVEDWAKLRDTKEADEAFQAYKKSGNDLSKLTKEQRETIALSKEMLAVDMAAPWQAVIEITERNKALMKAKGVGDEIATKLNDTSISAEDRGAILKQYMDKQGMAYSESGIKNAIEALDKAETKKDFAENKIRESGEQYVAAYANDFAKLDGKASYFDIINAEYNKEYDARRIAAPQNASDLRAFDNALEAKAAVVAPAASSEPAKATPDTAVIAATAFVPPPGLNLKDIPSLAALGVTGGQNAGAESGVEAAMQNVQMAKAPVQDTGRTA